MAEAAPLHELISRIAAPVEAPPRARLLPLGTMQALNKRLAGRPLLDFVNATLRGVGQVIFVNNPEVDLLRRRTGGRPLTWNQFIEVLLLT